MYAASDLLLYKRGKIIIGKKKLLSPRSNVFGGGEIGRFFRHFFGSKTIFLKEKGMTSSPSKSLRRGYVMGVFYKSIFDEKES